MPAANLGFGRAARLTTRLDFKHVFTDGRKTSGRNLILWWLRSNAPAAARLGLSVSAKVGTAVRRNRLKRLTREAFRLNRKHLQPGSDIVVCLRPACGWQSRCDAQRDLLEACRKAGLLLS